MTNVLIPLPLPLARNEMMQHLASYPFGKMGGSLAEPRKNPAASKKRWTAFASEYFDMAVKDSDGTVVVKGFGARRLTLWIRPNGEAGTTAENDLELDQLANEEFAKALIEITDRIGEWAGRVKRRKHPQGPSLLFKKSVGAIAWRRHVYPGKEAKEGFFFKSETWEWPFSD